MQRVRQGGRVLVTDSFCPFFPGFGREEGSCEAEGEGRD